MIYPAVVTCLGLVVVIVMSFTLVPAMSSLYASLNTELPLATRGMMAFSNILLKQPWIVAFPILGIVAFFKNWGRISRIPSVQTFFLKMPGISGLVRKSASAVGFRTLALLIEANVRLTTALDITGQRIMQFAGQRTTLDLEPIGEADDYLIQLTSDILPDPDAILVTGITPQRTKSTS